MEGYGWGVSKLLLKWNEFLQKCFEDENPGGEKYWEIFR